MKTMNDLFLHFLQDIYYAEKASAKSITKLLRTVTHPDVLEMLRTAKEHAQEPIERLDRVFEAVGKRPRGKACEAMNGLLTEAMEAIEEGDKGPILDAALIACLQGVKTYEITRYGSLLAFARQMGLDEAVTELTALRDAARADDERLTAIAEGGANAAAQDAGAGETDEAGEEPEEDEQPGDEPEQRAAESKAGDDKKKTPAARRKA